MSKQNTFTLFEILVSLFGRIVLSRPSVQEKLLRRLSQLPVSILDSGGDEAGPIPPRMVAEVALECWAFNQGTFPPLSLFLPTPIAVTRPFVRLGHCESGAI